MVQDRNTNLCTNIWSLFNIDWEFLTYLRKAQDSLSFILESAHLGWNIHSWNCIDIIQREENPLPSLNPENCSCTETICLFRFIFDPDPMSDSGCQPGSVLACYSNVATLLLEYQPLRLIWCELAYRERQRMKTNQNPRVSEYKDIDVQQLPPPVHPTRVDHLCPVAFH